MTRKLGLLIIGVALDLLQASPASAQTCRSSFAPGLFTAGVTDIQRQLAAHGYDPGPADGRLGRRTCQAILAYRRDAGLPPNAVIGPELLNHLHFTNPPVRARNMKYR